MPQLRRASRRRRSPGCRARAAPRSFSIPPARTTARNGHACSCACEQKPHQLLSATTKPLTFSVGAAARLGSMLFGRRVRRMCWPCSRGGCSNRATDARSVLSASSASEPARGARRAAKPGLASAPGQSRLEGAPCADIRSGCCRLRSSRFSRSSWGRPPRRARSEPPPARSSSSTTRSRRTSTRGSWATVCTRRASSSTTCGSAVRSGTRTRSGFFATSPASRSC